MPSLLTPERSLHHNASSAYSIRPGMAQTAGPGIGSARRLAASSPQVRNHPDALLLSGLYLRSQAAAGAVIPGAAGFGAKSLKFSGFNLLNWSGNSFASGNVEPSTSPVKDMCLLLLNWLGWHTSDVIYFYGSHDNYFGLTNFSRDGFTLAGKDWPTSEHYYQAQKFIGPNSHIADLVKNATSPMKAYQIAKEHKAEVRPDWDDIKYDVMRTANLAKYRQNEHARNLLLSTGNRDLVESSPVDGVWGHGKDKKGQNWLGKILKDVRELMKTEFPGYEDALAREERMVPHRDKAKGYVLLPYPKTLLPLMQSLKKAKDISQVHQALLKAAETIPGFRALEDNQYAYQGFVFRVGNLINQNTALEVIRRANQLNLKSIPKLVEHLQVNEHYGVLISEWPGLMEPESFAPYVGNDPNASLEERRQFYKEMDKLAEPPANRSSSDSQGTDAQEATPQPHKLGYYAPLLSRETEGLGIHPDGHVVLRAWDTVIPLSNKGQKNPMLKRLKSKLNVDDSSGNAVN